MSDWLDANERLAASREYALQARTGYPAGHNGDGRSGHTIGYSREVAALLAVQEALFVVAAALHTSGCGRSLADAVAMTGDVQP